MKFIKGLITFIAFILLFIAMLYVNPNKTFGLYGIILLVYLSMKMILSFIYSPATKSITKEYEVACVIPTFNENGESLLMTLESILEQTYPIKEIYIVDDGSPDKTGYNTIKEYIKKNPEKCSNVELYSLPKNAGKRHAQSYAFKKSKADVFFTVDSDSYIYPNALEELLKAFEDEEVKAVTGHINAKNRQENLLTQLIDIRYDNAFRVERAAQSVTGNILTCSGPLSIYRREVIVPNLEAYLNQEFLGVKVNIGDDRCLTNFANKIGKTKYQSTALCITDVPNNLKQFLKQQLRWNKSFFRESLNAIKLGKIRPVVALWSILEVSLFVLLTGSFISFLVNAPNYKNIFMIMGLIIVGIFFSSFVRNIHYLVKHPLLFLLSPFYAVIHLFLLNPLRLYALLTIRDVRWGTREKEENSDEN